MMGFALKPLPYELDALEPHISKETLKFHHGKHHQGYVDKLNDLVEGTATEDRDLTSVVRVAAKSASQPLFNNAAQAWNHDFFWNSMTPEQTEPSGSLATALEESFDGISGFKQVFKDVATGQFGSGWAWLVAEDDALEVLSTSDADLPLVHGKTPLICCDVWEHAYYLDYQNERGKFVDSFLENLINWDFAAQNLQEANDG